MRYRHLVKGKPPLRLYSMYSHQSLLPKLPVPSLAETCDRYLGSLRPISSQDDYARNLALVNQLQAPGAFGHELQKRLLARYDNTEKGWLIDWWNDYAYMGYRDPISFNVNYFYAFADDLSRRDPSARAAAIVTGALAFRDLVVGYVTTYLFSLRSLREKYYL